MSALRGALAAALASAALAAPASPASPPPEAFDGPERPAETVFATATVRGRPLASATASVTVIDRREIEASGARTVAELLDFVPGVDVTRTTPGGLTSAQIRGGDPNFTLVLVDGLPVNDPTYPVGDAYNLEGLTVDAVERVEVVRGPLSARYGAAGLAGAIHVVTRPAAGGAATATAEVETGDASLRRAAVAGRRPGRRLGVSAAGWWGRESERIGEERFERSGLVARLSAAVARDARLRLTARHGSWRSRDYPEASGGPLLGSGELRASRDRETSLAAELETGGAAGGGHRLSAALYRHRLERESPGVLPLVPPSVETTRFSRLRLDWSAPVRRPPGLALFVGADLSRESGDNDSLLLLPPFLGGAVPGDYAVDRTLGGAFVELLADRGRWTVELASRLDLPEGAAARWSPRLGAAWRPRRGGWRLSASAGRAFKLPSFFALASPPALGGNPELAPETAIGADLGVERALPGLASEARVTLFVHRFEDLVDFDFETFRHLNRSRVDARGAEASWRWAPRSGLSLAADVTWQRVRDRASGAPLLRRPRWTGGVRLDWRPRPALDVRFDLRGRSSQLDRPLPAPGALRVDGHLVFGAGASLDLGDGWRATARLDNLGDRRYESLAGFPGAGRSLRLALRRTLERPAPPAEPS